MYVDRVRLRDVKCFADVELNLQSAAKAKTEDRQANWNVILGENGDGKTSLLQGIAACLMDATTADRVLRPDGWVRRGAEYGALDATLVPEEGDAGDGTGGDLCAPRRVAYRLVDLGPTKSLVRPSEEHKKYFNDNFDILKKDIDYLYKHAFARSDLYDGWLVAGYGPFRRPAATSSIAVHRQWVPSFVATLFMDDAAIVDGEAWLLELDRQALRHKDNANGFDASETLAACKKAITELLPGVEAVQIDDEVTFVIEGKECNLEQLSHGYRSVFAMAIDILQHMQKRRSLHKPTAHLVETHGVVLIDEVDVHLHPAWQRRIGFMLCKTFPNLQFIVTSHSPFVAMAAAPGGLTVLKRDPEDGTVTADQDVPYVRGWAVDEVLSQLFGQSSLRDPQTEKDLERYETLRTLSRAGTIGPRQKNELRKLEAYLDERLRGEPVSPKNQRIDEDIELIAASLAKRNGKRKHA